MKTKRHTLVTLLTVIALSLSLAACGKDDTVTTPESATQNETASTQADTAAATEQSPAAASDNAEFDAFLRQEFIEGVSEDTLTLHYSLKNPAAYGIDLQPTFGDLDFTDNSEDFKELQQTLDELTAFDYSALSARQQQDYNIIKTYIEDNLASNGFELYGGALGTVSGVQNNLPINFAEYKFYVERDITDYLSLLSQVPEYFDAVIKYEQARIDKSMGMPDFQIEEVIKQCENFISIRENNYLISTFNDRIDAFSGLDSAKKDEYKSQNKDLILNTVFPCYEKLIAAVREFTGKAVTTGGLSNLPDGKTYYEHLVRYDTGSSKTVDEMVTMLDNTLSNALNQMYLAASIDYEGYSSYYDEDSINYGSDDPTVLLDTLKLAMMETYPEGPQTEYTIKYVEKALEESLSPAFYMVPPIDDAVENVIYINNGSTSKSGLFTTLAHEGYPGHLYQTNYYNSTNPNPIRHLLNFNGYVEGWATYVELQSPQLFTFTEHNEAYTILEQCMTTLNLVVSSRIDIGVNYESWTLDDVRRYLTQNGLNEGIAEDIYEYVIIEPANYLKYCVSALEFMELQDYAKQQLGDSFDIKEFNKALLDCGPCQFEYVRASVDAYISAAGNN